VSRLRLFHRLMLAVLALTAAGWSSTPLSPETDDATELLNELTPAQRVGQLFLVAFDGPSLEQDSPLLGLVRGGLISGVVLSPENDNFPSLSAPAGTTQALIAVLQEAARYPSSLATPAAEVGDGTLGVPLLVAVRVDGDGTPWSQTLQDYPETPSQMAIGAAWDRDLAREVGADLGNRFQQLGANLLIGPSLDVLGDPRLGGPEDLGVGSFGGDPYWTGILGQAFVEGVHAGSGGRVGVIVTHFPGLGASDRAASEDIATVRRTLDQLQGFELQPFAAVAALPPGESAASADGMLTAHIRFQGLLGNIRDTTQPVSLDAEAFKELTEAEPFASWRSGGGLMVSDSLGSRAIRRFLDPSETTFSAQAVARDAFLAGNDLLLLEDFRSTSDPDEITTIQGTLRYFEQRYQDDPVFAQRVDEAATRVLALKLRLYGGSFDGDGEAAPTADADRRSQTSDVEFRVARSAATLVSPDVADVRARLGRGPQLEDRMVLFTDTHRARACTTCAPVPGVDPQALEKVILSLYGGGSGTAQIRTWNLTSFATADLAAYLGETPPDDPSHPIARAEDVAAALSTADWVVFLVERERPEEFGSGALQLLLNTRPELVTGRKLVVFALDVPYGLDATDISKVDAMYALYSRGPAFLNVAARLLFQELPATGDLPVSVPAIGYDLIEALSPDPDQVIGLSVSEEGDGSGTPGAEGFRVNDTIRVTTDVILDANGHAVPDRTPVEFSLGYPGELPANIKAGTQAGVASTSATLGRLGLLTITAQSEPARSSSVLQLNVQENMPAFVTVIAPTAIPTLTVEPATADATPTPDGGAVPGGGQAEGSGAGIGGLAAGLIGAAAVSTLAYRSGTAAGTANRGRLALVTLICSLLGYNYVALGFPGAAIITQTLGSLAPGAIGVATGMAAWGCWHLWIGVERRRAQQA
jgi:beta-N-acetylhexosaminidase